MSRMPKQTITYNTITIILLHIVYWVGNEYPRRLLERLSWHSVVAFLFNLLFFSLYLFVLMIIFAKNKCVFSKDIFDPHEPVSQRFRFGDIAVLLGAQLVFDGIQRFLNSPINSAHYIVTDICIFLNWLLVYGVFVRKQKDFLKNPKRLRIAVLVLSVTLLICMAADVAMLQHLREASQKYKTEGAYFQSVHVNLNFYHGIVSLVFDSVIGGALVILQGIPVVSERRTKRTSQTAGEQKKHTNVTVVAARAIVLLVGVGAFLWIKSVVSPVSFIKTVGHSSVNTVHRKDDQIYDRSKELFITRWNTDLEETICFKKGWVTIYQSGHKVGMLTFDGKFFNNRLQINSLGGNIAALDTGCEKRVINGCTVEVYQNWGIAFAEGGKPQVLTFDTLSKIGKNEVVLALCRQLVAEGNMAVFDYCHEYLALYDYSFLQPYLLRYAERQYTSEENECMEKYGYRSEYFPNLSQRILDNTENS